MTRKRAACLTVVNRSDATPASLDDITATLGAELGISDPYTDREAAELDTSVLLRTLEDEAGTVWQLQRQRGNEKPATLRIDALTGPATEVAIQLDASVEDSETFELYRNCVCALVDSPILTAVDAGHRLCWDNVWVVREPDAAEFADCVTSPERQLPVVAYTPRDDDVFDPDQFADIAGLAHVAYIPNATSWLLADELPYGFNVYGGAVRLWWPNVAGTTRWDHPLWTPDTPAPDIATEVCDLVIRDAVTAVTRHPRLTALRRLERQQERRRASAEAARTETEQRRVDHERAVAAIDMDADIVDTTGVVTALEQLVHAQGGSISRLEEALHDAEELAAGYAEDAEAWQQRAGAAETERDRYLAQLQAAGLRPDRSEEEAAASLRCQVDDIIDSFGDVEGARHRPYEIKASFEATLEQLDARWHPKVLRAMADIVMGTPARLAARDDHPLRASEAGGSPQRKRDDGAVARRCAVERNTPSARRIHYWVLDGAVEFASVNVHDDMKIPD